MVLPASFLSNLASLKDTRLLVTGGAGFLGRHLVDALLQCSPAQVIVFDVVPPKPAFSSPLVKAVVGDLLDVQSLIPHLNGVYAVFHCASPPATSNNPTLFFNVNVNGTKNVIEACHETGVSRLVFTSSASVVFDGTHQRNFNENAKPPKTGLDAYTRSKLSAEVIVLSANGSSLHTVAIRPHGIFGPKDPHFIPNVAKTGEQGKSKYAIGDGSNLVDFTYVENVAYAHCLAAVKLGPKSALNGKAYFITNKQPILFWDFLTQIQQHLGYSTPSLYLPVSIMKPLATLLGSLKTVIPSLPIPPSFTLQAVNYAGMHHYYSCNRATADMGYHAPISLEDGLQKTMASFSDLKNKKPEPVKQTVYTAGHSPSLMHGLLVLLFLVLSVFLGPPAFAYFYTCSLWYQVLILFHLGLLARILYQQTSFGEPLNHFPTPQCPAVDLSEKTALITGGNRGLGFHTAVWLAKQKMSVIIACRDKSKGETAVKEIQRLSKSNSVSLIVLDTSNLPMIKATVQGGIGSTGSGNNNNTDGIGLIPAIDLLIHNAGAMTAKQSTAADRFDYNLVSNYLGPFLLTQLMVKHGKLRPGARVLNVTSVMHSGGTVNFDDLQKVKGYNRIQAYSDSKLYQILFTMKLQRVFDQLYYEQLTRNPQNSSGAAAPGAAVGSSASLLVRMTAVAVNPGAVATDFIDHWIPHWLSQMVMPGLSLFLTKSIESGVETICYAAASREMENVGGVYSENCRISLASDEARDRAVQERLWDVSLAMLNKYLS